MQKLFMIMVIFVSGLWYFTKDKDFNDIQKAIGNPATKGIKTKSERIKEAEKPNKYDVGQCVRLSKQNKWEVNKIIKVDIEKMDYYYIYCVKFKGCQKEVQKEIISNFEYEFPESSKVPCP